MTVPVLFQADATDLRGAYEGLQERYVGLNRPRFYFSALVVARLIRAGHVPRWRGFARPVPAGGLVNRQACEAVIEEMFAVPTGLVMRPRSDGVLERFANLAGRDDPPDTLIVDPYYAQQSVGRAAVQVPRTYLQTAKRMFHVDFDDASWLWNSGGTAVDWSEASPREFNIVNTFNQQNGMACAYPTDDLRAGHPYAGSDPLDEARTDCPHWNDETTTSPTTGNQGPYCAINGHACAAERAGQRRDSPAPRVLLGGPNGQFVAPRGINRILAVAAPNGESLPRRTDLAVVLSASRSGGGRPGSSTALLDLLHPTDFERLTEAS